MPRVTRVIVNSLEGSPASGPGIDRLDAAIASVLAAAEVEVLPPTGARSAQAWVSVGLRPDRPDRLGPAAAREAGIPYVVVASAAEIGDTDFFRATLEQAGAVIAIGNADADALEQLVPEPERLLRLSPFVDTAPFTAALKVRVQHRAATASHLRLPLDAPWLLAVGPMEHGAALESFAFLARAFSRLAMLDWHLVVAGSGPASEEVRALLRSLPENRLRFWEPLRPEDRPVIFVSCDMLVWPALHDVGVDALLEAQAAGLAVVACASPRVGDRVRDSVAGRLAPSGNAESFANQVGFLLRHPEFARTYGRQAREVALAEHDVRMAGRMLCRALERLVRNGRA